MTDTEYRVISDGRRLDVLLSEETGLSRSRVAALMEDSLCEACGKAIRKAGTRIPAGQEVILRVPAPREAIPQAEEIPLEILYEDADLAVVVKPRGMVVHPAAGHPDGTLVNALLAKLDTLGGIGGELRPGIVHRLDKDTSGLMLVAKNDETQAELSRMLKDREIEKHYRALAEGRPAVTRWKVLEEGRDCTLLDVRILTGRTHQIRVHLKSIHHPVCGDPLYGFEKGAKVPCLMLHAYSLEFRHPRTGKKMTFQAPLPGDFLKGLKMNGIG